MRRLLGRGAAGDADRPGGAGKTRLALEAAAGLPAATGTAPGSSSWPRWPTPTLVRRDGRWPRLGVREAPGRPPRGGRWPSTCAPGDALLVARQLRAPASRPARALVERAAAAPCPDCGCSRPAASRCGVRRRAGLARAAADRAARRRRRRPRRSRRTPAVRLFVERARRSSRRSRSRRPTRRRSPRSARGWTASRWRSSWPRRGCASCPSERDRRAAGRPLPAADRRRGAGAAAPPADAAGAGRLEPRPARRAGARAVPPAGRLRRRLDAGGGRGGRAGRRAPTTVRRARPAGPRWSTVAGPASDEVDGEPRYRLLETVRAVRRGAAGRGRRGGRGARPHRDWCLALAERAAPELSGPRPGAPGSTGSTPSTTTCARALARCAERGRRARAAAGRGPPAVLARARALRGGPALAGALLARPPEPTEARLLALVGAGMMARAQGDFAVARSQLEEGAALARELGSARTSSPRGCATWPTCSAGRATTARRGRGWTEALTLARATGRER